MYLFSVNIQNSFCLIFHSVLERTAWKEMETWRGRLLTACGRRVEEGGREGGRRGIKTISSLLLLL